MNDRTKDILLRAVDFVEAERTTEILELIEGLPDEEVSRIAKIKVMNANKGEYAIRRI